mgnify:CR=1 FL=1
MPSVKTNRVQEKRRARNTPLRSRVRTFISKAREVVHGGDKDIAETAVKDAIVALDKAAQKGVVHKKNASRRKSRLMKMMNAKAKE